LTLLTLESLLQSVTKVFECNVDLSKIKRNLNFFHSTLLYKYNFLQVRYHNPYWFNT